MYKRIACEKILQILSDVVCNVSSHCIPESLWIKDAWNLHNVAGLSYGS
jgi:hypothetical protein